MSESATIIAAELYRQWPLEGYRVECDGVEVFGIGLSGTKFSLHLVGVGRVAVMPYTELRVTPVVPKPITFKLCANEGDWSIVVDPRRTIVPHDEGALAMKRVDNVGVWYTGSDDCTYVVWRTEYPTKYHIGSQHDEGNLDAFEAFINPLPPEQFNVYSVEERYGVRDGGDWLAMFDAIYPNRCAHCGKRLGSHEVCAKSGDDVYCSGVHMWQHQCQIAREGMAYFANQRDELLAAIQPFASIGYELRDAPEAKVIEIVVAGVYTSVFVGEFLAARRAYRAVTEPKAEAQ